MSNNNEPFSLFVSKLNFLAVSAKETYITTEEFIVKYPELEEIVKAVNDHFKALLKFQRMFNNNSSMALEVVPENESSGWSFIDLAVVGVATAVVVGFFIRIKNCKGLFDDLTKLVNRMIADPFLDGAYEYRNPQGLLRFLVDPAGRNLENVKDLFEQIKNRKECFRYYKNSLDKLLGNWQVRINGRRERIFPELTVIDYSLLAIIAAYIASASSSIWETILLVPSSLTLSPDWLLSFSTYVIETTEGVVPESVINIITGAGELIAPYQSEIVSTAAFVLLAVPAIAGGMVAAPLAAVDAALYYLFGWGIAAGAVTIGSGGG